MKGLKRNSAFKGIQGEGPSSVHQPLLDWTEIVSKPPCHQQRQTKMSRAQKSHNSQDTSLCMD